mmetsp:Transcript_4793/g.11862  ORF Transcript_4793/g.11862 Transcript_4793/m.11862 type:complete len:229 (+) Transcript_4793:172-858(+)
MHAAHAGCGPALVGAARTRHADGSAFPFVFCARRALVTLVCVYASCNLPCTRELLRDHEDASRSTNIHILRASVPSVRDVATLRVTARLSTMHAAAAARRSPESEAPGHALLAACRPPRSSCVSALHRLKSGAAVCSRHWPLPLPSSPHEACSQCRPWLRRWSWRTCPSPAQSPLRTPLLAARAGSCRLSCACELLRLQPSCEHRALHWQSGSRPPCCRPPDEHMARA